MRVPESESVFPITRACPLLSSPFDEEDATFTGKVYYLNFSVSYGECEQADSWMQLLTKT